MSPVIILLVIVIFIESTAWMIAYDMRLSLVERVGGWLPYSRQIVFTLFIPELITVWSLFLVINLAHRWLGITTITNTTRSILWYECQLLPFVALSFLFFSPLTQTARYVLTHFPNYAFSTYWREIVSTYTLSAYLRYLFPILLIGYMAINISLLKDYSAIPISSKANDR